MTEVALRACGADNPAGLDSARLNVLLAGGAPDALRLVYPYDGTVFPRGLAAPVVMWEGDEGMAEAVYLQLRSSGFSFQGCLKPDSAGKLSIPQNVWEQAAAATGGKRDPFELSLTVLRAGKALGPVRQQLIIAPGTLKGSVFYNSYSSALARKQGAPGGAVLRIRAGQSAELFVGQRACAGCHGASADGSRLVTNEGVYALTPDQQPNPAPLRSATAEYPGLSPDGSLLVNAGQLIDTDTGAVIPSALPLSAQQLTFSPDGLFATFIEGGAAAPGAPAGIPAIPGLPFGGGGGAPPVGTGTSNGLGKLMMASFARGARSFSGLQPFKNVSAAAQFPSFLPDSKAILFADASSNDLMLLDVASGQVSLLARAMGFASDADARAGKSALPYGSAEARQAFFPTVAPVAAGGYFWVFFDSARRYGTFDTRKIESGLAVPGGINLPIDLTAFGFGGLAGLVPPSKQLWVTAIEIAADGSYRHDPSAPAFYLPGQEMGANNHRAFAALDACREQATQCASGTECCSGFCEQTQCVAPPSRCSATEEACQKPSDCCNGSDQCINGYCSLVTPLF